MHPSQWLLLVCISFLAGVGLGALDVNFHPWLEAGMLVAVGVLVINRLAVGRRHISDCHPVPDMGSRIVATGHVLLGRLLGATSLVSLILDSGFRRNDIELNRLMKIIALVILAIGLGLWRMEAAVNTANQYATWFGQSKEFEGLVVETDKRNDRLLVNVRPDGLGQLVQLRFSPKSEFEYGDRVWVRGKITQPKASEDFDYPKFLASRGVAAIGYYPKMVVLSQDNGNFFLQQLLNFKFWLVGRAEKTLSHKARGLVLGVLLGSRQGIDQNIQEWFTIAGLSHILVASGYNLTVLVAGVAGLVWWFGRKSVQILAAVVVVAFVGIAGASASIVRAGIMAWLVILSRLWGRQYSPAPSLILAASLMVLYNPQMLVWDAGFQLSFAATAGILYFAPEFYRIIKLPILPIVNAAFSTSLAAILATLPLILFHFERLSMVALPANLLVVPFVPVLMLLGALSLFPWIGMIAIPFTEWLSNYIIFIAKFSTGFSWASLPAKLSATGLLLGAAILVCLYVILRAKGSRSKILME